MRIVIVEDHQMFREVIHKVCVSDFGYDVVGEAGDGAEALRVILAEQPDFLLLDLHLPDMDGFTIVESAPTESGGCAGGVRMCIRSGHQYWRGATGGQCDLRPHPYCACARRVAGCGW